MAAANVVITAKEWCNLSAGLPCGPSDADKCARTRLFRIVDGNGNGLISPTEMELYLQKLFGSTLAERLRRECRAAFDRAKAALRSNDDKQNELLSRTEFRQFLGDGAAAGLDPGTSG